MDISLPWKLAKKDSACSPQPETDMDTTNSKHSTNHSNNDSDNDTESASSSDKDTAPPTQIPVHSHSATTVGAGVASSFARAGKLLWNSNPLAVLKKQHARTVSDFSESDFSPFPPGTPVWTRYGLGTVVTTRADDGFLIVTLQGQSRMTLFLHSAEEDYYSVPAIRHDWVETPAGDGRVLSFDAKTQMYRVSIGTDSKGRVDVTVNVHRNDLRRVMPTRRATHAPAAHHQHHQPTPVTAPPTGVATTGINIPTTMNTSSTTTHAIPEPSVITKGLNSALKSIVTTSSGLSTSTYQFVSNYYYQGQCVVTTYGSGTIVALDQINHRAHVQLTWGATASLHTDAILYYTKALDGMEVATKFGAGVVTEVRAADGMYTVKLSAPLKNKDSETEVVYVHESDLTRGSIAGRRMMLGSAQKHVKDKINVSTKSLFSFAQNKVKLFGGAKPTANGTGSTAAGASTSPATKSPSLTAPLSAPSSTAAAPSRSKSTRVVESDGEEEEEEVSSAGI